MGWRGWRGLAWLGVVWAWLGVVGRGLGVVWAWFGRICNSPLRFYETHGFADSFVLHEYGVTAFGPIVDVDGECV